MNHVAKHQFPLACPTGRWTLTATILASSMAFIDGTALNVILPSLQRDLQATGIDLFWILNGYLLMLAAVIIVGGSLGDKLGRVRLFKVGIVVFTIGSMLCGFSPSVRALILFRMIQGVGGALMIPGSLAIISETFAKNERGKAIGTWSAATTIVMICGPILGGALADAGLWRFIFYINVPLGIVSWLISTLKIPESRDETVSTIDWIGAFTLVGGLGFFTFGLLEISELAISHPLVIGSIIVVFLFGVAFIVTEKKVSTPMMPLELFQNRNFFALNLRSFFLYAAIGAIILFLSLNLVQIQGYSQLQAGLTFLPFSVMMILLGKKMGTLTDKYGPKTFLTVGPMLAGGGMLWLSFVGITKGPAEYWSTYFPGFILFSLGMAVTVVPLTTAVMTCLPENKSGIASGVNNSITRIAGTFTNAVLGAVAIVFFAQVVLSESSGLNLTSAQLEVVKSESAKLGGAMTPESIPASAHDQLNRIFDMAFIETSRMIGIFSAVLAWIAGFIALFLMRKEKAATLF